MSASSSLHQFTIPKEGPSLFPSDCTPHKIAGAVFAISVLAAVMCLFHQPIGAFLEGHRTFSTLLLPATAMGCGFAALMHHVEGKNKKLLALAVLTGALVLGYLIAGGVAGFSHVNAHASLFKLGALSFCLAFSTYFLVASRKPYQAPEGTLTAVSFPYGSLTSQEHLQPIMWKKDTVTVFIPKEEWDKQPAKVGDWIQWSPFPKEFDKVTNIKFDKAGNAFVTTLLLGRCEADLSQRRPCEEGSSDFFVPIYEKLFRYHGLQKALHGPFTFALRAVAGIIYNVLRIPFLILYLIARLPYDLYRSEDALQCLGKRFMAIHKVIADSIRNIFANAVYGAIASASCFPLIVEGIFSPYPRHMEKFISKIEQLWNETPLRDSYWSLVGPQIGLKCEGWLELQKLMKGNLSLKAAWKAFLNLDPEKLNNHGFYLMGCMQPVMYARVNVKGEVLSLKHLGGASEKTIIQESDKEESCKRYKKARFSTWQERKDLLTSFETAG